MRLVAEIVPVRHVPRPERERLFALLEAAYDHVAYERFERDFDKKDDVILLREGPRGRVAGFSTLKNLAVEVEGRSVRGVYSGDTVVDPAYWGQRVLGQAFLGYLFRKRLQSPFHPFYWMLISKGYKTYLLMANNFPEHWPRFEAETPPFERAVQDAFARSLFGDDWKPGLGVIRFAERLGQLREGVADITDELRDGQPRVRFFEAANPGWREGDELVCVARMSWSMPVRYAAKAIVKLGPWRRAPRREGE